MSGDPRANFAYVFININSPSRRRLLRTMFKFYISLTYYRIAAENSKISVKLCCMVTGCAKQLDAAGNLEIVRVVLCQTLVRKLSDH